jgi:AbrB family looped-hinge helix DNA binding protein
MAETYRAKLNDEGRLVIPASCRKHLGLQPGQEVLLKMTKEGLLLTTFDQALKQFQDEVAGLAGPGVSLANEVIAERRAEAAEENGE